jgi:hypothetical protein
MCLAVSSFHSSSYRNSKLDDVVASSILKTEWQPHHTVSSHSFVFWKHQARVRAGRHAILRFSCFSSFRTTGCCKFLEVYHSDFLPHLFRLAIHSYPLTLLIWRNAESADLLFNYDSWVKSPVAQQWKYYVIVCMRINYVSWQPMDPLLLYVFFRSSYWARYLASPLPYPVEQTSIHPTIHPYNHSSIQPTNHPSIQPTIHSIIHLTIHPTIHPSIQSSI